MAFKITEDCIACGVCPPECPNDAISEGDPIYTIDPDKCTECIPVYEAQQCAEVCPVDCCIADPDHEENRNDLESKYKVLHPA